MSLQSISLLFTDVLLVIFQTDLKHAPEHFLLPSVKPVQVCGCLTDMNGMFPSGEFRYSKYQACPTGQRPWISWRD